jgi:hypothetical protein
VSDDFSELMRLANDLSGVPAEANKRIKKAIEFTARGIKDDWKQGAEISGGFPASYPASISYEMQYTGGSIDAEIGPVLGFTPGSSAGFLDEPLSSAGVDGPVHHAGRNATEANEPDFYEGLEIAITDAVIDKLGA